MLFSRQSVAEDRGIKIVAESGESVGHYENSYALVIGVSDYPKRKALNTYTYVTHFFSASETLCI
jgi:hypothetical protein